MRKQIGIILCALCLGTFGGAIFTACTPEEDPTPDDPVIIEPNPTDPDIPGEVLQEGIAEIIIDDVRVQLLSDTLVRIENKGPEGFEDRASYVVSNRTDWSYVSYTLEQTSSEVLVQTANYTVHVPVGGTAEDSYITKDSEELWRFTDAGMTTTNVYLPSPSDELKSWYFTDSPRIIPSEYGYSITDDDVYLQDWDFDNDATDVFVFLPQGDYEQFCTDYVSLTGESEMITLQMFGYWDSRWYAYSTDTALQQVQDYLDRGYSIDILVIDTDWRDASSGTGYEINTDLFPNIAAFLELCEEMGVSVVFNDHPEPVSGTDNALDSEEVEYRNTNLTLLLSLGLDYWWYDRNWSVSLNSVDPDVSVYAFGMYIYQWVTQEYLESITDLDEYAERALIMGNVDGVLHGKWTYASDLSAHRYSIQWTGDIGADSTALAQEIYTAIFGGAEVGLPYMSSDIGGHTQAVTDEQYVRWIQYGALSTIMRVHCTNASYIGQEGRMPWLFGDTAEEVAHTYINMRYRLLPIYYALAYQNYETGVSIMRRLDIVYPEYEEASRNDEYLLGDYILVAPISESTNDVAVPDENLTHYENGVEVSGLKAYYYNNSTWTGVASKTKVDSNISFDWGTSGPTGLNSDNFSVKWTGYITIGSVAASLSFYADDAVLVYIDGQLVIDGSDVYDTYLSTDVLEANSKHSIEVWFAEYSGSAHIYMYYVEQAEGTSATYNSRTVFIPDGTWIDVWTGTRYYGPTTITVTHPLETSPIFVREGSLVTLAQNMSSTSEKDWSEMSLEVYPSKNYSASVTLYEDDTTTVAYKSGEYRTTDITMDYDNDKGAVVVTINAAEGTFSGSRAFTERTWNIRVHQNPGWGEVLKIKVNGVVVNAAFYAQSSSAEPFAFTGAALDGDVYEFVVSGSVYETYVIEIYYSYAVDSQSNTEYDNTALNFTLNSDDGGDVVNLEENGTVDWISYGEDNSLGYVQKENGTAFSTLSSYDDNWTTYDSSLLQYTAEDEFNISATTSQKDFSLEIQTIGSPAYYVLYVGGNQCTAKLTVRDRAGNVSTITLGNIDGTFLRRVVIYCDSSEVSTLYINYSSVATVASGTSSPSYVTLLCGYVCKTLPENEYSEEGTVTAEVESVTAPTAKIVLSEAGESLNEETLDWMQFATESGVQKINADYINGVTFYAGQTFYDYSYALSYYDGLETTAHTGTTNGTCTPETITISVTVTENVKHIILYTGAWRSTGTVEVYSRNGTLLAQSESFTAGESSVNRVVVIAVDASVTDFVTIIIRSTNAGVSGNVSFAGMAVTGTYSYDSSVTLTQTSADVHTGETNLTETGTLDWYYVGTDDEKANANAISEVVYSSWNVYYTASSVSYSYTDGEGGSESGQTNGICFDYSVITMTVDENTDEIILYVSVVNATTGIVILDENGRILLNIQPCTDSDNVRDFVEVHISVTATQAQTLTLIVYKGGSGGGSAGLDAIAVTSKNS